MIIKYRQQDISKTIWPIEGPSNLVCLYGMVSTLPDRPDTVDWTVKPNQKSK